MMWRWQEIVAVGAFGIGFSWALSHAMQKSANARASQKRITTLEKMLEKQGNVLHRHELLLNRMVDIDGKTLRHIETLYKTLINSRGDRDE